MKKWIAVFLSLVLLLGTVSAMAENPEKVNIGTISINGTFTLQCGIPEGYTPVPILASPEQVIAVLKAEDPEAPVMMLSVAFDETYSDVMRMNDLTEEELDLLEQTYIVDDPNVEITYGETGYGTQLLIARHDTETQDYISFLSIYQGYFIEFVLTASEEAADKNLTDDQLQMSIAFLTDLDFVPGIARPMDSAAAFAGQTVQANLTDYDPETRTVQVDVRKPVTVDAETVMALQPGDSFTYGTQTITVDTIEKLEEDENEYEVNGDVILRIQDDRATVYEMDMQIMETAASLRVEVTDSLVFVDGIDPETGDIMEEPTEHSAAEFMNMLTAGGYPDFASDNVNVSFDRDGTMTQVERFYTPWQ
ncbi:MAG: hypothetical protein IJ231_11155 [Clostridia bacterium]|nr:hypothetical protein [Clostridia bacterium]